LAPAAGEKIVAIGEVIRAGNTITIATGEVFAYDGSDKGKQIALMQVTLIKSNL